jgi:hypothetical protein
VVVGDAVSMPVVVHGGDAHLRLKRIRESSVVAGRPGLLLIQYTHISGHRVLADFRWLSFYRFRLLSQTQIFHSRSYFRYLHSELCRQAVGDYFTLLSCVRDPVGYIRGKQLSGLEALVIVVTNVPDSFSILRGDQDVSAGQRKDGVDLYVQC